ncbi:hypothetical protein DIS24_g10828 [Lasiodiplodia hormozganensis]|uniref:Uncharacterized protein n=1 Tax=Lasiodiplodia hormozganensis TaxID=869390 RepID=A0AA39X683_9PEZI|nr:hypothetical protein DIS24_g10828 [Lasiodiplodia hormozganensis]
MSSFDARGFLPAVVSKDDGACCPSSCAGLACTRRRALISDIVAEVDTLNADIQRIILQGNSQPRSLSSGVANLGTDQVLVYALDLLRANVASLRDLTTPLSIPSGTGAEPQSAATAAATAEIRDVMKRRFDPIANQEVSHFLPRPTSGGDRTIPPPGPPEDVRRSFQGTLQTLRQEYDALLSKLDRQRTKCATLEKKFEVTDVEINGLTAEKEELEARVAALELQVEELREQRDDARRREVRTGEQYRSIVEMAGKLQGMAAEEKRAWAQEREGLLNALGWKGDEDGAGKEEERRLETGGVGGTFLQPTSSTAAIATNMSSVLDDPMRGGALFDAANPPLSRRDSEQHAPTPAAAAASSQVIAALRVEVAQLRSRTQTLETAIRSICDQGTRMEEASQTIAEAGRKMKEAAREAIGDR